MPTLSLESDAYGQQKDHTLKTLIHIKNPDKDEMFYFRFGLLQTTEN
jgi:hypothetical protein